VSKNGVFYFTDVFLENFKLKYFQVRPEQIIVEPVLKSQYLTKLKRLLPTYLEDLEEDRVTDALQKAALSAV
jgi:hypothetical protein